MWGRGGSRLQEVVWGQVEMCRRQLQGPWSLTGDLSGATVVWGTSDGEGDTVVWGTTCTRSELRARRLDQ